MFSRIPGPRHGVREQIGNEQEQRTSLGPDDALMLRCGHRNIVVMLYEPVVTAMSVSRHSIADINWQESHAERRFPWCAANGCEKKALLLLLRSSYELLSLS